MSLLGRFYVGLLVCVSSRTTDVNIMRQAAVLPCCCVYWLTTLAAFFPHSELSQPGRTSGATGCCDRFVNLQYCSTRIIVLVLFIILTLSVCVWRCEVLTRSVGPGKLTFWVTTLEWFIKTPIVHDTNMLPEISRDRVSVSCPLDSGFCAIRPIAIKTMYDHILELFGAILFLIQYQNISESRPPNSTNPHGMRRGALQKSWNSVTRKVDIALIVICDLPLENWVDDQ